MTNSRLTDPEVLETRFPVLLREFSLRHGSGGAGRHRGGDGLVRRVEFREAMTANVLANHRRIAPFGLAGWRRRLRQDATASGGAAPLSSETLAATFGLAVEPGDEIQIETPGGGGFGPLARLTRRSAAGRAAVRTIPAPACAAVRVSSSSACGAIGRRFRAR